MTISGIVGYAHFGKVTISLYLVHLGTYLVHIWYVVGTWWVRGWYVVGTWLVRGFDPNLPNKGPIRIILRFGVGCGGFRQFSVRA